MLRRSLLSVVLLLSVLPLFAQLSPKMQQFLQRKGQSIHLSDTTDFSDLKKLGKVLKGKRIVLLGESTHGAREINLLKNRLIRFLHQELGYRVLLFESGIGEIFCLNRKKEELAANELLYAGLMGPWQSKEFVPLLAYLQQHPDLQPAGFDVQRTGRSFGEIMEELDSGIAPVGYAGLVRTEQLFSRLRGQLTDRKVKESGELKKNIGLLIDSLQMARQVLENQRVHFQAGGWSQNDLRIVDRSLQNRIDFLQIYYQFKLDQNYVQRFAARDSVMAENIIWLADQIYPGEKIIISAHNYHISRFNERDFVMGEKLAEVYGEDLYAIGLFPGTGSFANNSRKAENMETTGKADDLQQIILQSGLENTFLPIPRKPKRDVDWLFQPITVNNTFINIWGDDQLTLADSFDGLILLRKITPAVYR